MSQIQSISSWKTLLRKIRNYPNRKERLGILFYEVEDVLLNLSILIEECCMTYNSDGIAIHTEQDVDFVPLAKNLRNALQLNAVHFVSIKPNLPKKYSKVFTATDTDTLTPSSSRNINSVNELLALDVYSELSVTKGETDITGQSKRVCSAENNLVDDGIKEEGDDDDDIESTDFSYVPPVEVNLNEDWVKREPIENDGYENIDNYCIYFHIKLNMKKIKK